MEDNGCEKDADCPSKEGCFKGQCENPCLIVAPCVENAICTVYDDLPLRTMTCRCKEGFIGKGNEKCEPIRELLMHLGVVIALDIFPLY